MEKYSILLGYYDKQLKVIRKLYEQINSIKLSSYDPRYTFALKVQQFYTAIEDLLKQIAKAFENHIEDLSSCLKEILIRLSTEIPNFRPHVLSSNSFLMLDKMRSFRHFIRHAYDCELIESELVLIQTRLKEGYEDLLKDFMKFRAYVEGLSG